jgi:hypothetical protein
VSLGRPVLAWRPRNREDLLCRAAVARLGDSLRGPDGFKFAVFFLDPCFGFEFRICAVLHSYNVNLIFIHVFYFYEF